MTQEHRQAVTSDRPRVVGTGKRKNARILRFIAELGYPNVNRFCSAAGLSATEVGNLINCKAPPRDKRGRWRSAARQTAVALVREPNELWPASFAANPHRVAAYVVECEQRARGLGTPADHAIEREFKELVDAGLAATRYGEVLRMRFGLEPYDEAKTLEQIGERLGVNRERARQFVARGLQDLRRPSIGKRLRSFCVGEGE